MAPEILRIFCKGLDKKYRGGIILGCWGVVMKGNIKMGWLFFSLFLLMNIVSLFAQDTIPDGLNFVGEKGSQEQTENNISDEFNIPVLIIFSILILAVLIIFSKLKFIPIFTALAVNALTIISSLIQFKHFFHIVVACITGTILFFVFILNFSAGGWAHSKKGGGRDRRYKNNTYIEADFSGIVIHTIFSFVLLIALGVISTILIGGK
jgi:hypothetical protein